MSSTPPEKMVNVRPAAINSSAVRTVAFARLTSRVGGGTGGGIGVGSALPVVVPLSLIPCSVSDTRDLRLPFEF